MKTLRTRPEMEYHIVWPKNRRLVVAIVGLSLVAVAVWTWAICSWVSRLTAHPAASTVLVGSTIKDTYHLLSCRYAYRSHQEALGDGKRPCSVCLPMTARN